MQVGFDRQIYKRQSLGGISRYFSELNNSLRDEGVSTLTGKQGNWINSDIVHATFYGGSPYSLSASQVLVSSLFDMIPEKHPEYFPFSRVRSPHENKEKWLSLSDLIISISDSSSDDLAFFYPKLKAKIQRVHLSTSMQSVCPIPIKCLEGFDYFLYIGKRTGYKNAMILLRALSFMAKNLINSNKIPSLVFAGGGKFSKKEQRLIQQNNLGKYVIHMNVDDSGLSWLYKNAKACLVPSIAEGFSLPLIESLVLNTPLAASDIEVHNEVSKGFSTVISANNANAWAEYLSSNQFSRPEDMLGTAQYDSKCSYFSGNRLAKEHIQAYSGAQALIH